MGLKSPSNMPNPGFYIFWKMISHPFRRGRISGKMAEPVWIEKNAISTLVPIFWTILQKNWLAFFKWLLVFLTKCVIYLDLFSIKIQDWKIPRSNEHYQLRWSKRKWNYVNHQTSTSPETVASRGHALDITFWQHRSFLLLTLSEIPFSQEMVLPPELHIYAENILRSDSIAATVGLDGRTRA